MKEDLKKFLETITEEEIHFDVCLKIINKKVVCNIRTEYSENNFIVDSYSEIAEVVGIYIEQFLS